MIIIFPNQLFPIENYLKHDTKVYFCHFAPFFGHRKQHIPFAAPKARMIKEQIDKYLAANKPQIAGVIPLDLSLNADAYPPGDEIKIFDPSDKLALLMIKYVLRGRQLRILKSPAFLIHEAADNLHLGLRNFHTRWIDRLRQSIKPHDIIAHPDNMLLFLLEMGVILPDDVLLHNPGLVLKREYYRQIYRQMPDQIPLGRDYWKFPTKSPLGIPPIDELMGQIDKNPMLVDDEKVTGIFLNFATISQIYPPSLVFYLVSKIPWYSHYLAAVQVYEFAAGISRIASRRPFYTTTAHLIRTFAGICSGDWEEIWNALYYNFIYENRDRIGGFVIKNWNNKKQDEKNWYLLLANEYYRSSYD